MSTFSTILRLTLYQMLLISAGAPACSAADSPAFGASSRCQYHSERALAGDPLSMSMLADCYVEGGAGVIDFQKAESWYRKSISQAPNTEFQMHANLRLAIFLVFERGSTEDVSEGRAILFDLAKQGLIGARFAKGLGEIAGIFASDGSTSGVTLLERLAEEGDYAANFLLYGLSVVNDPRVPESAREANLYWDRVNERLQREDEAKARLCDSRQVLPQHWIWRAVGLTQVGMDAMLRDLTSRLACKSV